MHQFSVSLILNLVKKDIFDFDVTTATYICMKAYERSNSSLPSSSTLKGNDGNTKSINFNYHCAKFSRQRSFLIILPTVILQIPWYRTGLYDIDNL